jgi:hypothetical protein
VGGGAQVLGSPVKAMRRLVGELARYGCERTGTLTQALPATPGGLWRGAVRGIDLAAIEVRLAKR